MSGSATGYAAIADRVDALEGWMTSAQGARLFAAAARCPAGGQIVEIGSFRGKSTVVLATAAPAGVRVIAIDPHAGTDRGPNEITGFATEAASDLEVFRSTLDAFGVADRIDHVRRFSERAHSAVAGEIDVVYIDGAHRYRPARVDIRDWGGRVSDGGTLLIHDSFSSIGVTLAILRILLPGRRFRYVGRSGSLAEFRADLGSAADRRRNMMAVLAQLPWFARNVLLKVALVLGAGRLLRRFGRPVPEWPY